MKDTEMRNILIKIPEPMHRRFKTYCSKNGVSMKKILCDHITNLSAETIVSEYKDDNEQETEKVGKELDFNE